MEIFIHQQNLLFLRRQLAEMPHEARRLQLLKLLADEEAKESGAPARKVVRSIRAAAAQRTAPNKFAKVSQG